MTAATDAVTAPSGQWRLLDGWARTGAPQSYRDHLGRHGRPPTGTRGGRAGRERLAAQVAAAGLTGRGGAGFPLSRKLAAVSGRRSVVLANGCEGEPDSCKDAVLLGYAPHLVIDGALLAAYAVGARDVRICVHRESPAYEAAVAAVAERDDADGVQVVGVPGRFVSSEESALVRFIDTGDARPTAKPPRVFERGVGGRPTLVSNVETLGHLALLARYGAGWYRSLGTRHSPGTALVTLAGAVHRPGVVEVAYGTTLGALLDLGGGPSTPAQAVLVGGRSGTWLPWPAGATVGFSHEQLHAAGGTVGVATVFVLPARSCGLAETARLARYLAGESAGQCGPCMFGLPAIADDLAALAAGAADRKLAPRLGRRLDQVMGRGACGHPDGAVRMVRSALTVFAADLDAHLRGRPCVSAAHRWSDDA